MQCPDEWKINEYIHNIGQAFNQCRKIQISEKNPMVLNQHLFKTILAQVLEYFLDVISEAEREELIRRMSISVL